MSDLPPSFQPARLKVARGRRHIGELEQALKDFVAGTPITGADYVVRPRDNGLLYVNVHLDKEIHPPPAELGPIVGDAIHNLRSALDLMACELSQLRSGGNAEAQFPFAGSDLGLNDQIKRKQFDKCGPDAVRLLKTLRPHKFGNTLLRALHDLDIADKHVSLTPAAVAATFRKVSFSAEQSEGKLPPPEIAFVFPDRAGTHLSNLEVIPTLHRFVETVESILEAFAALVATRG